MTLVTVICGAVWLTFSVYHTDERLTEEQQAEEVMLTIRKDDVHFLIQRPQDEGGGLVYIMEGGSPIWVDAGMYGGIIACLD